MAMGKPISLTSSNLRSVAYDPATRDLDVTFTNGNRYRYADVDQSHVTNLTAGRSAGEYFHSHIRSAHKATRLGV